MAKNELTFERFVGRLRARSSVYNRERAGWAAVESRGKVCERAREARRMLKVGLETSCVPACGVEDTVRLMIAFVSRRRSPKSEINGVPKAHAQYSRIGRDSPDSRAHLVSKQLGRSFPAE